MPGRKIKYYIGCQILGWGVCWMVLCFVSGFLPYTMKRTAIFMVSGLLSSHLLRYAFTRYHWLTLSSGKEWFQLSVALILSCILAGFLNALGIEILAYSIFHTWILFWIVMGGASYLYLFLLPTWAMLYWSYHYIGQAAGIRSKKKIWEYRLAEMEASVKSGGTDLDSIMDSISRIKSKIDENPAAARDEINELSQLLRKGYLR
jgi:hypothetical protein